MRGMLHAGSSGSEFCRIEYADATGIRHNCIRMEEYIMKKIVSTIAVALIMIITTAAPCFAGTFGIESTVPEDGAKNTTKENLCVKILFTSEVGNEQSAAANRNAFRIVDKNGKEYPSLIYYNNENPKYALILADTTKIPQTGKNAIQDDTEYTCILSPDFQDNDGNTLGEEKKISFTTMNQGRGMIVYMILMVGMMVAMMVVTVIQTKKEAEKSEEQKEPEETFNPYKEAKQSGKSVQEVIAEHEKNANKGEGIMGLLGGGNKEKQEEKKEERGKRDGDCYCVKKPQPISAAGCTYKTGRRAKAEAEAEKREQEKQARKAEGYSKKKSEKKDTASKSGKKKGGKK